MFKIVIVRGFLQSIYCKNSKEKKHFYYIKKKKKNKGLPLFIRVAEANLGFFFPCVFFFHFLLNLFVTEFHDIKFKIMVHIQN